MSTNDQRDFDYLETIKYGCTGDYIVEGSLQIVCQQDGTWSEKPSCKGRTVANITSFKPHFIFKELRFLGDYIS